MVVQGFFRVLHWRAPHQKKGLVSLKMLACQKAGAKRKEILCAAFLKLKRNAGILSSNALAKRRTKKQYMFSPLLFGVPS
jgi:hypothetical protein